MGEDERYLHGMEVKSEICTHAEGLLASELKKQQLECVNFSLANLQKHQRREWDLSDPHQLKKDKPARIEGSPRPPALSSMQKFEGEEGVSPERKKEKRDMQ